MCEEIERERVTDQRKEKEERVFSWHKATEVLQSWGRNCKGEGKLARETAGQGSQANVAGRCQEASHHLVG